MMAPTAPTISATIQGALFCTLSPPAGAGDGRLAVDDGAPLPRTGVVGAATVIELPLRVVIVPATAVAGAPDTDGGDGDAGEGGRGGDGDGPTGGAGGRGRGCGGGDGCAGRGGGEGWTWVEMVGRSAVVVSVYAPGPVPGVAVVVANGGSV